MIIKFDGNIIYEFVFFFTAKLKYETVNLKYKHFR